MKSYGRCPASCGEFVQGYISEEEYLCSYAIDLYSIATVEEKLENVILGPSKSRRAIEMVFKNFNLPIKESKNISLNINSQIPIGKGMASSTADIGATIMATLSLIGKSMTSEQISKLASKIEPTDSIFIEEANIFNPLNGEVIKYLGNVRNAKVLILEPNIILNTKKIRETPNYMEIKLKNKDLIREAFCLLEDGIKKNDLNLVGQACNISSLANENIHEKVALKEIIEISKNYGAYGVNVAHSGTVVGILLDKAMNEERLIELIRNKNLHKFYKKIYSSDIIDGGIKEGTQWNTSKNPMEIESKSFEIIQGIIDEIRPGYEFKNEVEEKIIKRAIHTTADFEYLDILKISDKAVDSIVDALNNKATIFTDTNMALSGINKRKLSALDCDFKCLVADEEVADLAKEKGITRSMAAVEVAAKTPGRKIFVLGNAPTALYKVMEMKNEGNLDIDAVVGVPVGFVGAAESKDELEKTDIPYIISKGRKGGSNLAAAIINAILYSM